MLIFVGSKKPGDDGFYPGMFLDTDSATGGDYLKFVSDFIGLLARDEVALERMANAEGRTLNHAWKGGVGSIPLPATTPQ